MSSLRATEACLEGIPSHCPQHQLSKRCREPNSCPSGRVVAGMGAHEVLVGPGTVRS